MMEVSTGRDRGDGLGSPARVPAILSRPRHVSMTIYVAEELTHWNATPFESREAIDEIKHLILRDIRVLFL